MEWRYLTGGSVKHALERGAGGVLHHVAPCGTLPAWYRPEGWLGTGSQSEYERVAELPECRRCTRILGGGP